MSRKNATEHELEKYVEHVTMLLKDDIQYFTEKLQQHNTENKLTDSEFDRINIMISKNIRNYQKSMHTMQNNMTRVVWKQFADSEIMRLFLIVKNEFKTKRRHKPKRTIRNKMMDANCFANEQNILTVTNATTLVQKTPKRKRFSSISSQSFNTIGDFTNIVPHSQNNTPSRKRDITACYLQLKSITDQLPL